MAGIGHFWEQADLVGRAVALLLLAMSVGSWALIVWKGWLLRRVRRDMARAVPAFWQAASVPEGRERLAALDRERVLLPLLEAVLHQPGAGSLEARGPVHSQLTRQLRDALHGVLRHLQSGQVALASIGSTAPFIGLFGTVWGIYHALGGIGAEGRLSLEKVSDPVGEALVMTAAGLAVAIPAVLAFNVFGKLVAACEADLEGYAHDLRELAAGDPPEAGKVGAPQGHLPRPAPGGARPARPAHEWEA